MARCIILSRQYRLHFAINQALKEFFSTLHPQEAVPYALTSSDSAITHNQKGPTSVQSTTSHVDNIPEIITVACSHWMSDCRYRELIHITILNL